MAFVAERRLGKYVPGPERPQSFFSADQRCLVRPSSVGVWSTSPFDQEDVPIGGVGSGVGQPAVIVRDRKVELHGR